MNILGIDTTGKHLSVLLKTDGVWHRAFDTSCMLNHSIMLNNAVDKVLKAYDVKFSDIDVFACNVGVGSFTGIRVGISSIKGFNLVLQKKLVSVNTFEILAYNGKEEIIDTFVPDNRGFYHQRFVKTVAQGEATHLTEMLVCDCPIVFSEEKDYTESFAGKIDEKVSHGEFVDELVPLYIRKSQAEENL